MKALNVVYTPGYIPPLIMQSLVPPGALWQKKSCNEAYMVIIMLQVDWHIWMIYQVECWKMLDHISSFDFKHFFFISWNIKDKNFISWNLMWNSIDGYHNALRHYDDTCLMLKKSSNAYRATACTSLIVLGKIHTLCCIVKWRNLPVRSLHTLTPSPPSMPEWSRAEKNYCTPCVLESSRR